MDIKDLKTYSPNTWCPGCGNFGILRAFQEALIEIFDEGIKPENIVIASGIGCHGKIVDYINVNSFYSIHGRVPPACEGIKIANPELHVIGFAGDGDAYGEGISHLIFAAKRNFNMTMIIHNNQVYGLTTGQFTPTSPKGYKGKSTPSGTIEEPLNPLTLMLTVGATFVARGFPGDIAHLRRIIKEGILHKGFSFIDILQPCVTFYNTWEFLRERVYKLEESSHNPADFKSAFERALEWGYSNKGKIPIGIFYRVSKPTYDEVLLRGRNPFKRSESLSKAL
jgi:2-oxoglutarate ferredoxin oxidoreductase subunit beta